MNESRNKDINKENMVYKIKVTTKDTRQVLIHDNVPFEHVEVMKVNPNLSVKILEAKVKNYMRRK